MFDNFAYNMNITQQRVTQRWFCRRIMTHDRDSLCLSLKTELLNMHVDVIDVAENVNTWQWNIATVDSDSVTSKK